MPILYTPNPSVAYWLTLVVTLLLPILVGLVTKASWSSGLKAVLLLAFSAATAIISNLLAVKGATDVGPMVTAVISTFVIAVAAHFGFWKPTEVSTTMQNSLVKDSAPTA